MAGAAATAAAAISNNSNSNNYLKMMNSKFNLSSSSCRNNKEMLKIKMSKRISARNWQILRKFWIELKFKTIFSRSRRSLRKMISPFRLIWNLFSNRNNNCSNNNNPFYQILIMLANLKLKFKRKVKISNFFFILKKNEIY